MSGIECVFIRKLYFLKRKKSWSLRSKDQDHFSTLAGYLPDSPHFSFTLIWDWMTQNFRLEFEFLSKFAKILEVLINLLCLSISWLSNLRCLSTWGVSLRVISAYMEDTHSIFAQDTISQRGVTEADAKKSSISRILCFAVLGRSNDEKT